MPRPKGRGAARQNKGGGKSLKSAWAGGNYHNDVEDVSGSGSDAEGDDSANSHKISTRLAPCSSYSLLLCAILEP